MSGNWPIYCGSKRTAAPACGQLATVYVDATDRRSVACAQHEAVETKWASNGGRNKVTTRPVVQPDGAVASDGQGTLFDLLDGAA